MSGYVLSPLAEADLDEIWDYSADRWGNDQANGYLALIRGVIERVAKRPSWGRSCDEIRRGYFRIAAGSHVVFYNRRAHEIVIVRVLHQSMDFARHL